MNNRPDLRELVARAINARDLSPSFLRETSVDRIGALAFADPLGAALWALKWAGDPRAYERALALLLQRTKRVCGDVGMRGRLCRAALLEWLDDICRNCLGRGLLTATPTAPVRVCHVCQGTGRRGINEAWRAKQLGIDVTAYRKWERRYASVQRRIVDAELQACLDVARQLGRTGVAYA